MGEAIPDPPTRLILTISGSLRAASSNSAALGALALLAPPGVTVRRYQELEQLPAFNPDLESGDLPDAVARLRNLIGQADAIVISSPEYARGMAGALKNMLDWLVGALEFPGKPVATITTSQRAEYAPEQLRLVLTTMSARVIEEARLPCPCWAGLCRRRRSRPIARWPVGCVPR
jgi:chromate reductase